MTNKVKKALLYALIPLTTFMYSCDDNNIVPEEIEEVQAEAITLADDGILQFNTMEDFTNTIMMLKDFSDDEIVSWNRKMNFNSLHNIYLGAKNDEQELVNEFSDFIDEMMLLETVEEAEAYEALNGETIEAFHQRVTQIRNNYEDVIEFRNNRIQGLRIYDKLVAPLVNRNGLVYVDNTLLQYKDKLLKVTVDKSLKNELMNTTSSDENEGIFIYNLSTGKDNENAAEDINYHQQCQTQWGPNSMMTGNTVVTNTVTPRYRRVKKTYCGYEKQCIDPNSKIEPVDQCDNMIYVCRDYYTNELIGYNYLNTRVQAVIRNYKIRCFFYCWEDWHARNSEIKMSGSHVANVQTGMVENYEYVKDISPLQSGRIVTVYFSDDGAGVYDYSSCTNEVNW